MAEAECRLATDDVVVVSGPVHFTYVDEEAGTDAVGCSGVTCAAVQVSCRHVYRVTSQTWMWERWSWRTCVTCSSSGMLPCSICRISSETIALATDTESPTMTSVLSSLRMVLTAAMCEAGLPHDPAHIGVAEDGELHATLLLFQRWMEKVTKNQEHNIRVYIGRSKINKS